MRVLVAPGSFGAELSAVEAAAAIAAGWSRRAPGDVLMQAPLSDGGAGLVDALHSSLGGELLAVTATDSYGVAAPGSVLRIGDTAYVESSQAFASNAPARAAPAERATSHGVGTLVRAAIETGATRIVVGIGGAGIGGAGGGTEAGAAVAPNDGGAGLLAAFGATSDPPGSLLHGVAGLGALTAVDVSAVTATCAGVELLLATDDETSLLGLLGTTNAAGLARGIAPDRIPAVDALLERFSAMVGSRLALTRGAGAGGGLGFGLLTAGATRVPGLATVTEALGLPSLMASADLVVTGEALLDFSGESGRLSGAVAALAGAAVRPCVALAQRVTIGARESRALGIESAYGIDDRLGTSRTDRPADDLAALAERVARTWSWSR